MQAPAFWWVAASPALFSHPFTDPTPCVQLWVNEMAAFVKSIDSNHLVTVGEEGFYPRGLPQASGSSGSVALSTLCCAAATGSQNMQPACMRWGFGIVHCKGHL